MLGSAPIRFRHYGRRAAPWLAAGLLAVLAAMTASSAYDALRERAFDVMLGLFPLPPTSSRVIVVDIDRRSLERGGAWPWPREKLARLLDGIASARPSVVGVDILIDGDDQRSPAALARQLAVVAGADAVGGLADRLPDGDRLVAQAVGRVPTVLGAALDTGRRSLPASRPAPLLSTGGARLPELWEARSLIAPPPPIARAAAGLAVIAVAGDSDGRVRRVPLLVLAAAEIRPGMALELVRVDQRASAFLLAPNGELRVGRLSIVVPPGGVFRLIPSSEERDAGSRISAADIEEPAVRQRLAGQIVLVGGTAPELGGLRTVSDGRLRSSVQIQADAVEQMLSGVAPVRPSGLLLVELASCLMAGIGAYWLAQRYRPLPAALVTIAVTVAWLGICAGSIAFGPVLLDPVAVPIAGAVSYGIATQFAASETRRREDALRRRFEQHLAPELVSRLVTDPELVKFAGEERTATILFTDIEDFTAMTERADPVALIAALDRYFETLSRIVVEHGGMVEKIVGDGIRGLFNAPVDLDRHPDKAVDCAISIQRFAAEFVGEAGISALGFGRTRIGIETGQVIVGDVGGGSRLDYTAYGNAMNMAARLEAANKVLGTSICIGETAAAQLSDKDRLRPLGEIEARGRSGRVKIYEPWPEDMTGDQRSAFAIAVDMIASNPQQAISRLRALAVERPDDQAIARLIERHS